MAQQDPLEAACSLVGRFQYHFGRVEQKIDQAVIKLLDLDDKAGPIVTGSVVFASKLNFVRTSAYQQAGDDKDKQFADDICDDVFKINNLRQIVIHLSFEPTPNGGVQFKRTVARDGRVRVDDQVWDDKEFSKHYSKMRTLETELDKLIELIKPVPFDLYTPWPDMYHRSNSATTPLAAHAAALAARQMARLNRGRARFTTVGSNTVAMMRVFSIVIVRGNKPGATDRPVNSSLRGPRVWRKAASIQTCGRRPGRWRHIRSRSTN